MSHVFELSSAARRAATLIALFVTTQALLGCVSTPPVTPNTLLPACRASQVVYCSANGSRSSDDICVCLDQSAAKATVDSL